jgi:hypothetical protein
MDSNSILLKIRKARQTKVTSGKITFICRRPTDLEMVDISVKKQRQLDVIDRFVTGWEGVTELDLFSSGSDKPVEFNQEVFKEWIADNPDYWEPIITAITTSYTKHQQDMEEAKKKQN